MTRVIASMELDCAAEVETISTAPSRLTERKYIEYSSKHNDEDLARVWFKLGGCVAGAGTNSN